MSKTLGLIEDVLHVVGCVCLAVMALLITADTLMRATSGAPISFQFELTEMFLMPALATLSLPYVYRQGGHICLDIVSEKLLGRLRRPVHVLVCLAAAAFFAALAWRSGIFAFDAFRRNDTYIGVIDWPMYIAYLSAPLGTGFLTLRLILDSMADQLSEAPPNCN